MEIWKPVIKLKDYYDLPDLVVGMYEWSSLGRIRSCGRKSIMPKGGFRIYENKIMEGSLRGKYLAVKISAGPKVKCISIHRIIAIECHPNPYNLPEVDHKDGDKINNHPDNLQWISSLDHGEKSNAEYYKFIGPQNVVIEIYNLAKFCRENNLCKGNMSRVHLKKQKQYKGYRKP